jgi:two-component system, NtrC family, response regulator AtoC
MPRRIPRVQNAWTQDIRYGIPTVVLPGRCPVSTVGAASADGPLTARDVRERHWADRVPLLCESPRMRAIWRVVEEIADTDAPVFIRGESGVGKDLVARAIHARSARRDGPFVKVNCAAIPSGLVESELFGHERGAFTGAYRRKLGQFECANKGTIYLDEIAELPRALQAKLLHVLQDLRFSRVGGHGSIDVDTRVIAATNRDLEHAIARGEFREDLYYRLDVVEIRIPPLRERKEEIALLASWFLSRFNEQYRRNKQLSPETMARLMEHSWSGNVRELENVIRRMVVLTDGEQAFEVCVTRDRNGHAAPPRSAQKVTESLKEIARRSAREAERQALEEVLERVQWNRAEASRILKVSYKTLLSKVAECGLSPPSR